MSIKKPTKYEKFLLSQIQGLQLDLYHKQCQLDSFKVNYLKPSLQQSIELSMLLINFPSYSLTDNEWKELRKKREDYFRDTFLGIKDET